MEATEFSMNFCDNIKKQTDDHSHISAPHSCNSAPALGRIINIFRSDLLELISFSNTDTVSTPHHCQISLHLLISTLSHHVPSQVRQTQPACRLCHFQLRRHPAADCGWYIDFIQCRVIVINSRKFRCHGTVIPSPTPRSFPYACAVSICL